MDDVIDLRDIETSSGHISTDEDTSFTVDEFEECRSTLLLLLLAVNRKDLYIVRFDQYSDDIGTITGRSI